MTILSAEEIVKLLASIRSVVTVNVVERWSYNQRVAAINWVNARRAGGVALPRPEHCPRRTYTPPTIADELDRVADRWEQDDRENAVLAVKERAAQIERDAEHELRVAGRGEKT